MRVLSTGLANLHLGCRRDAAAIRNLQGRKLVALAEHAVMTVPFWRARFAAAGLAAGDIRSLEDLMKIPVVGKAELMAAEPRALLSSEFPKDELREEKTSGTTGRPFTVHVDPDFVATRDALFLRALGVAGYRLWQRLMLVSTPRRRRALLHRWHYASINDDPERLLDDLNRFRPAVLYGAVTPLVRLARLFRASGRTAHRPRAVVTTAEALSPSARRALRDAFSTDPHDVYGLTETGMIAWECERHSGYHVSEETAIVELLPTDTGGEERRVVVTNLALRGSPLLRFDTGDLAVPGSGEPCPCGRGRIRLARVEGRAADCVTRIDGRKISPYRLTLALERIEGIERYQVVQEGLDEFRIRVEARNSGETLETRVRHAVHDVVGRTARVSVQFENRIEAPTGTKFRVVESRVQRPEAAAVSQR